jgi:hypothetical protein
LTIPENGVRVIGIDRGRAGRGASGLIGGARLETDPAACVAFRPKA